MKDRLTMRETHAWTQEVDRRMTELSVGPGEELLFSDMHQHGRRLLVQGHKPGADVS
jgi:hypothetical protein